MKQAMKMAEAIPATCPVCGADVSCFTWHTDRFGFSETLDIRRAPSFRREFDCGAAIDAVDIRGKVDIAVKSGCKAAVRRALKTEAVTG